MATSISIQQLIKSLVLNLQVLGLLELISLAQQVQLDLQALQEQLVLLAQQVLLPDQLEPQDQRVLLDLLEQQELQELLA
jgi:hypothetical protein